MNFKHPAFVSPSALPACCVSTPLNRRAPRCATKPPADAPGPGLVQSKSPGKTATVIEPPRRLSNVQVVGERVLDTVSDVSVHFRRVLGGQRPPESMSLGRIVVLGSGWAAHSLVKVVDMKRVDSVTVISPRNYFFFTPLLSASSVGTVEFRSIVEPLRACQPLAEFYEAFASDVDLEKKVVHCIPGKREGYASEGCAPFEVPYDTLVIACGETTSTFGVPGARKYACMLKEIGDARKLRGRILDQLETAALPTWTDEERRKLLHFVVVGGGPTGCEFAGELGDLVATDLASKYGKDFVELIQVTLLQSADSLLTQFEDAMQQQAIDNYKDRRVNVLFRARVTEVTENDVALKDGRRIDYGLLVWAAGNATRPIVGKIIAEIEGGTPEQAVKRRGKLVVDPWLRVIGAKSVLALGDCAIVEHDPLPSTAQVAGQQGAYVGRMLSKTLTIDTETAPILRDSKKGKELHPFRFLSLGIMAYIGNSKAVVQVDTSEKRNISVGGRIAYLLWGSVYAVKQVDSRSRLLVILDQLKAKVWGRDVSQF